MQSSAIGYTTPLTSMCLLLFNTRFPLAYRFAVGQTVLCVTGPLWGRHHDVLKLGFRNLDHVPTDSLLRSATQTPNRTRLNNVFELRVHVAIHMAYSLFDPS